MGLEEEFKIEIEDEAASKMRHLKDTVIYIYEKTK